MFMVDTFRKTLTQFQERLSPEHKINRMFQRVNRTDLLADRMTAFLNMHYRVAETLLYEVGLTKCATIVTYVGPQFQRVEMLCACLLAVREFFEIFLTIPVRDYFSFSIPSVRTFRRESTVCTFSKAY